MVEVDEINDTELNKKSQAEKIDIIIDQVKHNEIEQKCLVKSPKENEEMEKDETIQNDIGVKLEIEINENTQDVDVFVNIILGECFDEQKDIITH